MKAQSPDKATVLKWNSLITHWVGWALFFFFIVSILGIALRYYFIGVVPGFGFNDLKHGHSHAAMLGWAFLAASAVLIIFFTEKHRRTGICRLSLILNVIAVLGMSISFPLEGYGLFSISFSTLHLGAAYLFAFAFLRDLRRSGEKSLAISFARWSVIWMCISTIGLWAIAPVSATLGGLHPLYFMSIQWFLHFQLIGWFTFAVIAGLIRYLEFNGKEMTFKPYTFPVIQLSVILTYALSVNWSTPSSVLFYLNSVGVGLQLYGFYLLLSPLYASLNSTILTGQKWMIFFLKFGVAMLALRVLIQFAVVVPAVAEISYTLRMFVVAFIHLIMMGTFTFIAVGLLGLTKNLSCVKLATTGWLLFLCGFIITEILMFGQGVMLWSGLGFIPSFHHYMFWSSILFPVGLIAILAAQFGPAIIPLWRKFIFKPFKFSTI